MPRLPSIIRASTLSILSAATVLAACGAAGDRSVDTGRTVSPDTSIDRAATSAKPPAEPVGRSADARPSDPDDVRFVCPEGGIDEISALQDSVDQGHQPWRLSAPDVAAACTLGIPGTSVEPAGVNRYQVTDAATGESVIVTLAQPLGPDGIWVVTSVTAGPSATTAAAAPCDAAAMLPVTGEAIDPDGGIHITSMIVRTARTAMPA